MNSIISSEHPKLLNRLIRLESTNPSKFLIILGLLDEDCLFLQLPKELIRIIVAYASLSFTVSNIIAVVGEEWYKVCQKKLGTETQTRLPKGMFILGIFSLKYYDYYYYLVFCSLSLFSLIFRERPPQCNRERECRIVE